MESNWRGMEHPLLKYTPGKASGNEVGQRFWRRSYKLIHHTQQISLLSLEMVERFP